MYAKMASEKGIAAEAAAVRELMIDGKTKSVGDTSITVGTPMDFGRDHGRQQVNHGGDRRDRVRLRSQVGMTVDGGWCGSVRLTPLQTTVQLRVVRSG